jgi:hypothetical protein
VAKKPKDPNEPSRAFKRAQAAAERSKEQKQGRVEKVILVVSLIVSLVAIGVIYKKHHGGGRTGQNDPTYKALQDVGTTPFVSGCAAQAPSDDPVLDQVVPAGQKQKYPVSPPSSGPHLANPVAVNADGFYDVANRPPVEGLVANLKAGWTVLWYDPNGMTPVQVGEIKKAAQILHKDPRYSLFVASAWDDSYGKLPLGTPIALVRWMNTSDDKDGHRAYCHEPSGEAFRQFMVFYHASPIVGIDAQE